MKNVLARVLGMGVLALAVSTMACANDVENDEDVSVTNGVSDELHPEGTTATINCATMPPGFPQPPCRPDLTFGQTAVEIVEPGTNIAPGYYVHFQIRNESKKPSGPFKVRIKDAAGSTLTTYSFSGLAANGQVYAPTYAPSTCGWTRTIDVDIDGEVDEASEYNNTNSYGYACQRGLPKGGLSLP